MAVLAHVVVGLAAARVSPKQFGHTPLKHMVAWVLIADALDIVWQVLVFVRIERDPSPGPWSHGLFMSAIWSCIAALVAWRLAHRRSTGALVGLVVFSHWVVDFITHPMTALIPDDPGLPLFFNGSPNVGLGLYETKLGVFASESVSFLLAVAICLRALRAFRRTRASARPA